MKIDEYISRNKVLSMNTFLSAFIFVYISSVTATVFDPIFNFIFPDEKVKKLRLQLSPTANIEIGIFLLETLRCLVYSTTFYYTFESYLTS